MTRADLMDINFLFSATNATLGLVMGGGCIALGTLMWSLFYAGRKLTPREDRSELGEWLGVFVVALGFFFYAVAALSAARWVDLDPDIDVMWLSFLGRVVGVTALLAATYAAFHAGPLVLDRIQKGTVRL